ncbi:MAG TPA: hypothetical protein VNY31_06145 [Solirubrobacteraceae bacterium]|jgi:hypothetical protein|nr:hypothetical protein [Solirubrobacteraceae bacterium]
MLEVPMCEPIAAHEGEVRALAVGQFAGPAAIVSGGADGKLSVRHLPDGRAARTLTS